MKAKQYTNYTGKHIKLYFMKLQTNYKLQIILHQIVHLHRLVHVKIIHVIFFFSTTGYIVISVQFI